MLPWFGTITARENYASSMAEAEFVEIVVAKRKLALEVAQLYYQLYANRAKQKVLDENIQLLNTYERLALTSVEVGKASAVDVLRLQIRQNELQQKELEAQKNERLNVLQSTFSRAISQRNQARISFDTQTKNLDQARDAEEILTKNYETGTIDFNDLLDIQELQLKFQTDQIESVQMYYAQSAIINYLIN